MRIRLIGLAVVIVSMFGLGCVGDHESIGTTELLLVDPPATVTATAISSSRIEVEWPASAGAQGYYLFRGTGAGPRTYVTTVLGTSYSSADLAPATEYAFTVQAFDATSVSGDSNIATATTFAVPTALSPPTVTATLVSSSRIEVEWNAVAGAVKYYVFQAQGAGPSVYVTTVLGTSYSAAGLAADTYTFRVQAVDAAGVASADSNAAVASMNIAAPTGVVATAVLSYRIEVQWNPVAGAVKYYVFQAKGTGPSMYVSSVSSTSYVVQAALEPDSYTYRIQAVDAADVASGDSSPATAWNYIDAPTVTATAQSTSQIQVTWTAVERAATYRVIQTKGTTGPSSVVANVPSTAPTSYTATGLEAGTTYKYTVIAWDPMFIGASSNASATTLPDTTPITAPTNVTATPFSTSRIEVGWNRVTQAVQYYVFRAQGAGPMVYLATISCGAARCSYSSSGLTAGTTYSYTVQAVDAAGNVSASSSPPASATTPGGPAAPTGINAGTNSTTSITVTWNGVPDAVEYRLFQGTGTTSPPPPSPPLVFLTTLTVQPGFPFPSYRVQGLTPGTYYTYAVQAVDSMGRVSPMSSVGVTRTFEVF